MSPQQSSRITPIDLKHQLLFNEFDYQTLCGVLKNSAHICLKIQSLIKSGSIIRVKKGLYVLGDKLAHGPRIMPWRFII